MTDYDWWKTNPDVDYAGQDMFPSIEEEELLDELKELQERENKLEQELEDVRDEIYEVKRRLEDL